MNLLSTERFTAPPPAVAMFDPCRKCNGSGRYFGRRGTDMGPCFACKGEGKFLRRPPASTGILVSDDALRAAFDKLRASGLKRISLRMQGFKVKPAKADSKNPGALYVTETESDTYLGKIINGRFQNTRECTTETAEKVAALIADPMAAIKASGIETGTCAICGLELTDPESIARGIGPICAERLA